MSRSLETARSAAGHQRAAKLIPRQHALDHRMVSITRPDGSNFLSCTCLIDYRTAVGDVASWEHLEG